MISVDEFEKSVRSWANERVRQFPYTWPLKGGWEGWIQVELMAYFFRKDSTQDILREQSIYTNNRKHVDLLLNTKATMWEDLIPVEIKAQSFENSDNFIEGVEEDMGKLHRERQQSLDKCRCIAMALSYEQNTINQLRDIRRDGKRVFAEICRSSEISIWAAKLNRNNAWE